MAERTLLILIALGQDGLLEVIPTGGLNKASLARIAKWRDPKDEFEGAWREEHWPYISFCVVSPRALGCCASALTLQAAPNPRGAGVAATAVRCARAPAARRLGGTSSWDELVGFRG